MMNLGGLKLFMGVAEREKQSSPAAGGVDFIRGAHHQGLSLVHCSAQTEPFLTQRTPYISPNTP